MSAIAFPAGFAYIVYHLYVSNTTIVWDQAKPTTEFFNSPSSVSAGLRCRCPRCGEGHLFRGYLKLDTSCEACGLDFSFADPADGPAFFVMSGVSILVMGVWATAAAVLQPPIWLQFALVIPALVGGCLASLRPMKAWLVAEQYIHKAEEGRWASIGGHGEGGFVFDRRKASGG